MVKITCKICGKEYDDTRYDMLIRKGITNVSKRLCCDKCVEEAYKKEKII